MIRSNQPRFNLSCAPVIFQLSFHSRGIADAPSAAVIGLCLSFPSRLSLAMCFSHLCFVSQKRKIKSWLQGINVFFFPSSFKCVFFSLFPFAQKFLWVCVLCFLHSHVLYFEPFELLCLCFFGPW